MVFAEWNSDLSVGIESLDLQHKKLLVVINAVDQSISRGKGRDAVEQALYDMMRYTREHFSAEEKLMEENGYPDYRLQKSEHDRFIKKMEDFQSQFKSDRFALSVKLSAFLKDWLVNHIMGMDKKYTLFFQEKGLN